MAKKKPAVVPAGKNNGDSVVYKVMAALLLACLEVLITQQVCKSYSTITYMDIVKRWLGIAGIILAALTVAVTAAAILLRKRPTAGFALTLIALNLALCTAAALVLWHFWTGPAILLYFLYFSLAVLIAVFYLYQPEFFLLVIGCMTAAFGFYGLSQVYGSSRKLTLLVGAMMALVFLVLGGVAFLAAKHQGILKLGKAKLHILRLGTPLPLYITSLLWLLCLAAGAIFDAFFCYICVFAAIACAFIFAIYYTVKLK